MQAISLSHPSRRLPICLCIEFILISSLISLITVTYNYWFDFEVKINLQDLIQIVLLTTMSQIGLYYTDLYNFRVAYPFHILFKKISQAISITAIIIIVLFYLIPSLYISQSYLVINIALIWITLLLWRLWLQNMYINQKARIRVAIIGTDEQAKRIANELFDNRILGYDFRGFVSERDEMAEATTGSQRIGAYDQLLDIVECEQIDKIIVALADRRGKLPVSDLLLCKMRGIEVEDVTAFREKFNHKIVLDSLQPSWMIFSDDFTISSIQQLFKRLSDIVLAGLGLLFACPLMMLIAVIVKLGSPGPIFFVQERIGQYGKSFNLIKFRSMHTDAETHSGPVFATQGDTRIVPLGNWLRRLRLDELPQLFNILRGDMSFVGPRPERDFFVQQFKQVIPYYAQRLSVKPGLTGWAQVNYPYGETVQDTVEKLQLDLYYIKNMSLFLDAFTLVKTVKIILLMRGSR